MTWETSLPSSNTQKWGYTHEPIFKSYDLAKKNKKQTHKWQKAEILSLETKRELQCGS